MATLKKYDIDGKEAGEVSIEDRLLDGKCHPQLVKDYMVALMANQRQWSANTKGRKEVKCTNKKPHPQKGTGRARQGSLVSPQFRGGGIVFGPKPRPSSVRIRTNQKEKRAAIRAILSQKIQNNQVSVLAMPKMDAPKTKAMASFLQKRECESKRVLFLGQGEEVVRKSIHNIPKVFYGKADCVNGYDVMNSHHIVIMEDAVEEIIKVLGEKSHANA